jgi:quercetin dioxygenase-like cupin family protein
MLPPFVALWLTLVPGAPPAQLPPRGATVDRDSQPVYLGAEGKAGARILLDNTLVPGLKEAAMTELVMLPGAVVPEHSHDTSAELIYILAGHGTMVLDGKETMVREGMAIYIPAGVKHSLKVDTKIEPLRAIQVYTPGGPEQRFKAGPSSKE